MTRLRLGLASFMLPFVVLLMVVQAVPASAATVPKGYCSRGMHPGCVVSTSQISTLTDNSASFFINKGGSLNITICKSYSNTSALGGSFTAVKDYVSLNYGVTLSTAFSICTGASTPVASTGWWHWHGSARRWQSKVYGGMVCGGRVCLPVYSYPVAEERWHFAPTKG